MNRTTQRHSIFFFKKVAYHTHTPYTYGVWRLVRTWEVRYKDHLCLVVQCPLNLLKHLPPWGQIDQQGHEPRVGMKRRPVCFHDINTRVKYPTVTGEKKKKKTMLIQLQLSSTELGSAFQSHPNRPIMYLVKISQYVFINFIWLSLVFQTGFFFVLYHPSYSKLNKIFLLRERCLAHSDHKCIPAQI